MCVSAPFTRKSLAPERGLRRLGRRIRRPFQTRVTRVYVFDRTLIRVRTFPPLFTHERVLSLQERIDAAATVGGGPVVLEAEFVVYETLNVPVDTHFRGAGLVKTLIRRLGP
jgi:hypothetical protein